MSIYAEIKITTHNGQSFGTWQPTQGEIRDVIYNVCDGMDISTQDPEEIKHLAAKYNRDSLVDSTGIKIHSVTDEGSVTTPIQPVMFQDIYHLSDGMSGFELMELEVDTFDTALPYWVNIPRFSIAPEDYTDGVLSPEKTKEVALLQHFLTKFDQEELFFGIQIKKIKSVDIHIS